MKSNECSELSEVNITVTKYDLDQCKDVLPVIVYLAGYCCYSVNKKMKCKSCFEIISRNDYDTEPPPATYDYFNGISRGSLCSPDAITVNIVRYNYVIINQLTKNDYFKHAKNQRTLSLNMTYNTLVADEVIFPLAYCDNGHSLDKIQQMIIWASTNSLLNNYCNKENDSIIINKCNGSSSKKRKLQTVSK